MKWNILWVFLYFWIVLKTCTCQDSAFPVTQNITYESEYKHQCVPAQDKVCVDCKKSNSEKIVRSTKAPTTPRRHRRTNKLAFSSPYTSMNEDDNLWQQIYSHKNFWLLPHLSCGISPWIRSARIVDGLEVALTEFPWMVMVFYRYDSLALNVGFICGGTLISATYVLTAAHCVDSFNPVESRLYVRMGEFNRRTPLDCNAHSCLLPPVDIAIKEVINHRAFSRDTLENDIALLRLRIPVNIFDLPHIKPICLPYAKTLTKLPRTAYVAGWGWTEYKKFSDTILKAVLPIKPLEACEELIETLKIRSTERVICAGGRGRMDSCKGDSGGPLMRGSQFNGVYRYVQYGIVSFGKSVCGQNNMPAIYTRVDKYLVWILDHLKA